MNEFYRLVSPWLVAILSTTGGAALIRYGAAYFSERKKKNAEAAAVLANTNRLDKKGEFDSYKEYADNLLVRLAKQQADFDERYTRQQTAFDLRLSALETRYEARIAMLESQLDEKDKEIRIMQDNSDSQYDEMRRLRHDLAVLQHVNKVADDLKARAR
jgi:hypothetical protein